MLKIGTACLLGVGIGCYQYQNSNSFRSLSNLAYAAAHITYIYKYTPHPTHRKNTLASQYLRDALKANGGIYLKLGQLIASLDVIVPDEYRLVMGALTRECEKAPFEEVKATVEEELKYPLDVVFKSFDKQPISSASIGQVHKAVLLSGQKVAVKIQHRHLAGHVESDLAMLRGFVRLAKWAFTDFKYEWLVEGFEKNMRIELDFNREAQNMKRTENFLRENGLKDIYVPQLALKPTKRVLVMEFIDGIHIDEIENLRKAKIDMKKMGRLFSKMIIKMIHKEGFVHADTHSGNLMARKVNNRDQLVLLDHGLYQEMDAALIRSYNLFWLGLILNDPHLYEPAARQLGTTNPQMLCSILTSKSMDELTDKSRSLFDLNPSSDKQKIMQEAAKNHEKIIEVLSEMKREILLLLKTNEFARNLENMMSGRELGVYEDIATECVQNLGFSTWTKWKYYIRLMRASP